MGCLVTVSWIYEWLYTPRFKRKKGRHRNRLPDVVLLLLFDFLGLCVDRPAGPLYIIFLECSSLFVRVLMTLITMSFYFFS